MHTVTVSRSYGEDYTLKVVGTSVDKFHVDPVCTTKTAHGRLCAQNGWGIGVHLVRDQHGRIVGEGNCCKEVERIKSVASDCPQQQTESPGPGLSGALEVISKHAVKVYSEQAYRCNSNGLVNVGEEFLMEECLTLLGAQHLPGAQLLSDEYCGGVPGDCNSSEVAFHPLTTPQEFMKCMGTAFENVRVKELHADLLHVPHADG